MKFITTKRLVLVAFISLSLLLPREGRTAESALRVPILLNKPASLATRAWPVSVGIPLKKGEYRNADELTIVDETGHAVPCEITKTGDWEDGSLRWVRADFNAQLDRRYFLVRGPRAEAKDDIHLQENVEGVVIETVGVQYTFPNGAATFDTLRLDLNKDGQFEDNEKLISGGAGGFYVMDSQGKRSVLHGGKPKVEHAGKRHAVVCTKGDYLDETGERKASAVIYFHFYAGNGAIRISHKLIVTEDTNELWFREIGLGFPLDLHGYATGTFSQEPHNPKALLSESLHNDKNLDLSMTMTQKAFPHFGSAVSECRIEQRCVGDLHVGSVCGDWSDLSSSAWGLAGQVPGFAEQFPKAFCVSSTSLTIKLWAPEGGLDLDFRTPQVISNYFGHDWIPATNEVAAIANTAAGTAKTHDIWLYPHVGPLTPELTSQFGATKEEIYAYVDPAWIARSGVFGLMQPKDEKNFPGAEEVISDYFDRTVLAGNRIFPATGYLYWGMYPYSAQPWKLKDGRWYPTIHRLARDLEYDLKRGVWELYARSGERKYHDYARRYTRFLHDFVFSNCDAPMKPKGWIVQGYFHSPIVWGAFGEKAIAAGKAGRKPPFNSEASCLAYASSEDVIQFAYDYFLTGDLHSRDMARAYAEALIKETNLDPEYPIHACGSRPEAALRMIGSAYDLDHDPRLLELGGKVLRRLVQPNGEPNPEFPAQWGKWGDVFGAYYYYWVSTQDPLARKVMVRLAETQYRRADLDAFFGRSSPLLQAFALAYEDTGDPAYLLYLRQAVDNSLNAFPTLKKEGIDFAGLNQLTTNAWGQTTMTGQGPVNIGLPAAEAVLAAHPGEHVYVPFAIKPQPTQRTHLLFKKEKPEAAEIHVYVNNWGERLVEPRLLGLDGKPAKLEVLDRDFYRVPKPDFVRDTSFSKWYLKYEDQIFFKLRVPATVPSGIYELDLCSEVAFTVLRSDIEKVVQVAPDGLVLNPYEPNYFAVPAQAASVEFFAMEPLKITDPAGKEVICEDLKNGNYRFTTDGRAGTWMMVRAQRIPSFVRMKNGPLVVALGDAKRLFEVDASAFKPAPAIEAPKEQFVEGKYGKAVHLSGQFVQLAITNALPREQGTVEFWFRPLWSVTDADFAHAMVRMQLFRADPVCLAYNVDTNPGGSGVFHYARWDVLVQKAGAAHAQTLFEAGKWYHVAVTWNVDGKDSECDVFVNGRKKGYYHYALGMARDASPAKLIEAGRSLSFGSGHQYGGNPIGEIYDELRVSHSVRYRDDFDPPSKPFEPDLDTVALMHLDGDLQATVSGAPATAEIVKGKKLW